MEPSPIADQQSAIGNRQSAIGNQQSAIGNQQSGNFSAFRIPAFRIDSVAATSRCAAT
jgi:hypothetical protein